MSSSLVDNLPTTQIPPAQLFVGQKNFVAKQLVTYLQKNFCTLRQAPVVAKAMTDTQGERGEGCGTCTTCTQIDKRQYHGALWLEPEKRYTLDQIAGINKTIAFALDDEQHFFFIVQRADLLSTACANSLLKSVEEPPTGYHFLFVTERRDAVLPTIQSRCTTYTWTSAAHEQNTASILSFFKQEAGTINPASFLREIENKELHEQATARAVDSLLRYWLDQNKKIVGTGDSPKSQRINKMITILKEATKRPPMPGSSKIFWKELALQVTT